MKTVFSGIVLVISVAGSNSVLAGEQGTLWEVVTRMVLPGNNTQSVTQMECLPKGQKITPQTMLQGEDCEVKGVGKTAEGETWAVQCATADNKRVQGHAETRATDDSFQSKMEMSARWGLIRQYISGKRVGECDTNSR